jgi:cation transport ATPase
MSALGQKRTLPHVSLVIAGGAWFFSNDPVRALAVAVAATPCPLILAAPVASSPALHKLQNGES